MKDNLLGVLSTDGSYYPSEEVKRLNLHDRIKEILHNPELTIVFLKSVGDYARIKYTDNYERFLTITYYKESPMEYVENEIGMSSGIINQDFKIPNDIKNVLEITY